MADRPPKLGDVVDDYCSGCQLIMNHGVVGLVGDEIKRVRCNTCQKEHAYRHARIPKKKDRVEELFNEVLASIPATPPPKPAAKEPVPKRRRSLHLGRRPHPAPADDPPPDPEPRRRRKRSRGRGGGRGGGRRGKR